MKLIIHGQLLKLIGNIVLNRVLLLVLLLLLL